MSYGFYRSCFLLAVAVSALIAISLSSQVVRADGFTPNTVLRPPIVMHRVVTAWVQVTDSCRQALEGGTFTVKGPSGSFVTPPTFGTHPHLVLAHTGCPVPHGDCTIRVGCVSVSLLTGATYTITVKKTPPGHNQNLSYAICEGGSDCPHGPEVATVHVSQAGVIQATTLNYEPDGTADHWSATGTLKSPIIFHEFGIGNGSLTCDSDHDADDRLTGSRGKHCDSEHD